MGYKTPKVKWVVQRNLINEGELMNLLGILERHKIPYEVINIIPFERALPKTAPHYGPVIAYGSTTLVKSVPPSWTWYDEDTFKPSYWGEAYRAYYLNNDMMVMPLVEAWDYVKRLKDQRFFVRPDSDLKLFSGDVFMRGDFKEWYDRTTKLIKTGTYVNLKLNTDVCISSYKNLITEWRFFVVGETVVAFSQYRKNGKLNKSRVFDPKAYELARLLAKNGRWFSLAPGYVVDIALTDEGDYKIIEFNNFNSSGFYLCNLEPIVLEANIAAKIQWENGD